MPQSTPGTSQTMPPKGVGFPDPLSGTLKAKCCELLRNSGAPLVISSKSKHWHTEQEWRLVVASRVAGNGENIKYRPGHFGLIPYTELAAHAQVGPYRGHLPIEQVVVGPHREQELAAEAMRKYLANKGYGLT